MVNATQMILDGKVERTWLVVNAISRKSWFFCDFRATTVKRAGKSATETDTEPGRPWRLVANATALQPGEYP
jgi:hypothetical protein